MQTPSPTDRLQVTEAAGVLTFMLNRPDAGNEIDGGMFDAMLAALAAAAAPSGPRVLRVRANGAVFCTGRERAGTDAATMHAEVARLIELKKALRATSMITIAEVQGDAHGFGMGLAMLCDFTLVSSDATLAFPEMRKGLPPAAIMAYLNRYALPKTTFPLVLFGDRFTPAQALAAGLVSEVCAPETLAARAAALVDRILALDPDGARHCKSFFQSAQEATLEQNFRHATEALVVNSLRLRDAARAK